MGSENKIGIQDPAYLRILKTVGVSSSQGNDGGRDSAVLKPVTGKLTARIDRHHVTGLEERHDRSFFERLVVRWEGGNAYGTKEEQRQNLLAKEHFLSAATRYAGGDRALIAKAAMKADIELFDKKAGKPLTAHQVKVVHAHIEAARVERLQKDKETVAKYQNALDDGMRLRAPDLAEKFHERAQYLDKYGTGSLTTLDLDSFAFEQAPREFARRRRDENSRSAIYEHNLAVIEQQFPTHREPGDGFDASTVLRDAIDRREYSNYRLTVHDVHLIGGKLVSQGNDTLAEDYIASPHSQISSDDPTLVSMFREGVAAHPLYKIMSISTEELDEIAASALEMRYSSLRDFAETHPGIAAYVEKLIAYRDEVEPFAPFDAKTIFEDIIERLLNGTPKGEDLEFLDLAISALGSIAINPLIISSPAELGDRLEFELSLAMLTIELEPMLEQISKYRPKSSEGWYLREGLITELLHQRAQLNALEGPAPAEPATIAPLPAHAPMTVSTQAENQTAASAPRAHAAAAPASAVPASAPQNQIEGARQDKAPRRRKTRRPAPSSTSDSAAQPARKKHAERPALTAAPAIEMAPPAGPAASLAAGGAASTTLSPDIRMRQLKASNPTLQVWDDRRRAYGELVSSAFEEAHNIEASVRGSATTKQEHYISEVLATLFKLGTSLDNWQDFAKIGDSGKGEHDEYFDKLGTLEQSDFETVGAHLAKDLREAHRRYVAAQFAVPAAVRDEVRSLFAA